MNIGFFLLYMKVKSTIEDINLGVNLFGPEFEGGTTPETEEKFGAGTNGLDNGIYYRQGRF